MTSACQSRGPVRHSTGGRPTAPGYSIGYRFGGVPENGNGDASFEAENDDDDDDADALVPAATNPLEFERTWEEEEEGGTETWGAISGGGDTEGDGDDPRNLRKEVELEERLKRGNSVEETSDEGFEGSPASDIGARDGKA